MKKCAIHQPNFLPWIGYWMKLAASETFILYDSCPLNEQGFTRRVKIQPNRGQSFWSSLELLPHSHGTTISNVAVNWTRKNQSIFHAQLKSAYGALPYYVETITLIKDAMNLYDGALSLATLNTRLISLLARVLSPKTKLKLASEIVNYEQGQSMLIKLCKMVEADIYLSGAGGNNYIQFKSFQENGLKLQIVDFDNLAQRLFPGEKLDQSIIGILAKHGVNIVKKQLSLASEYVSNTEFNTK